MPYIYYPFWIIHYLQGCGPESIPSDTGREAEYSLYEPKDILKFLNLFKGYFTCFILFPFVFSPFYYISSQ